MFVALIFPCPADDLLSDYWQQRILLGTVETRSVKNVKNTHHTRVQ